MQSDLCKASVKQALLSLHLQFAPFEERTLRVMQAPKKGVFAGQAAPAGKLKLVPASNQILLAEDGAQVPAGALDLGAVMEHPIKGTALNAHILRHCQLPQAAVTGFVVPYWLVRSVPSEEEANMEIQTVVVSHTQSTALNPKVGSKAAGKTLDHRETSFHVPLLVNSRALEFGDELLVFKAAPPKRPSTVALLPAQKKSKSSGSNH